MATKQHVLDYIQTDRSLKGGRDLYNKFTQKNLAIQGAIARMTDSQQNIRIVCYELCKLVNIPERQLNALLNNRVQPKKELKPVTKPVSFEELEAALLNFTEEASKKDVKKVADFLKFKQETPVFVKGVAGNTARKKYCQEHKITVNGKKNADYDKAIAAYLDSELVSEILFRKKTYIDKKLADLPTPQKQSIKLRDQFPFLREADCPKELKLIVSDLITAWEDFVKNQPLLHKKATQEQMKAVCDSVVSNYIANKQAWDELEHYKKTQSLLGVHPIFEELKQEAAIKKLSTVDLSKKITNITNNITRNRKKFKEATISEQKDTYSNLLSQQEKLKAIAEKELATRK